MWCIYICPFYMRCHAPILFTCIMVLNRLVVKGGCTCEIWIVGQITSWWVGQDKQGGYKIGASWPMVQSNPRTRPGWTYSRGAARDSRSSMYKMYIEIMMLWFAWNEKGKIKNVGYHLYDWFVYELLYIVCMTDMFIFLQVKNKLWLPWVYSWIRHCRKQFQPWDKTIIQ